MSHVPLLMSMSLLMIKHVGDGFVMGQMVDINQSCDNTAQLERRPSIVSG